MGISNQHLLFPTIMWLLYSRILRMLYAYVMNQSYLKNIFLIVCTSTTMNTWQVKDKFVCM